MINLKKGRSGSSVSKEMRMLQDFALILLILGAAVTSVRGHGNMIWPPVWQVLVMTDVTTLLFTLRDRGYSIVTKDTETKVT